MNPRYPAQLAQLGVNPEMIKHGSCSMESDKVVCVCEKSPQGQAQIVIVDMVRNSSASLSFTVCF